MAESKKKTAGTAKAASAKTKNKNNEKKTGRGGSSARQKPQAPKSASKQGSARADSTKTDTTPPAISQGGALLGALLLTLLGLFCGAALLFAAQTGTVGLALHNLLLGLFGCAAYVVPVLLLIEAAFFKKDVEYHAMPHKCIFGLLLLAFVGVLFHCGVRGDDALYAEGFVDTVGVLWESGKAGMGGGLIGGALCWLLSWTGIVGTLIISIPAVVLLALFFVGMTPKSLYITVLYKIYKYREKQKACREQNLPDMKARQEQLAAREEALAVMRAEAAERRRIEQEYRRRERSVAREEQVLMGKRRRGAIDRNIYATDGEEASAAEQTAAPLTFGTAETPAATEIAAVAAAASVQEQTLPDPDAYSLAEADESDAVLRGERNADTAMHDRVILSAEPGRRDDRSASADEIDLAAIFNTPNAAQNTPPGDSFGYEEQAAELELCVTQSVPDGCAMPEADDVPPFDTDGAREIPLDDPNAEQLLSSLTAMYGGTQGMPAAPSVPQYQFPPITLLKKDLSDKNEDVAGELETNAARLVEILRSFNVKTRIVNVSRGPTITRYELQPESGTRVRSVANLVDDIALGLAADGVRIEAPIPGKSAIGIEVPNRSVSTVYIRELIDSEPFRSAKSRLTTCLGMDVAGAPVFLDAAKMPHLLICGATGMGKSVCINALIVSMLYKATPDEVKLILIDPKKVELNIYSGIPHLLVPVVSDPKKAAGSLHWAVTEMERRFALIEDVGMRDIKGYNDITKNDPDREYLPQIVIIIDELADLMMTAPDEVEESICRLAQKARAAGMHLIIGTQRPSVDVITGLIKANIPSRIAFRVSSQMDSRVVLDVSGAEKLIGRGDMLYSPVGAPKPQRVQGSFVSEDEIDAVVGFIKKNAGHAAYSDSVMESIEREAALCGQKKGRASAEGEVLDGDTAADDPMLRSAVELAVESGKISTSLIQRRLSLGYGRAAKLIDRMEQLGYVSAPEGQKPRQVLITREQYMELVLKQEEII